MSKVENTNGEFTTKLKDEQFLRFADKSTMGVILIQRGYLQYFNKRFQEIFGYSHEEILTWKKREFYKIVHPDDLQNILQQFTIEDSKTVSVRFRGITKDKRIINIENYVCRMTYNNKSAYLSSYVLLDILLLLFMNLIIPFLLLLHFNPYFIGYFIATLNLLDTYT